MLVDLSIGSKTALAIGKEEEVTIRAKQLLEEGAMVSVLLDGGSRKKFAFERNDRLQIRPETLRDWKKVIENLRPFLAVIATGDPKKDQEIAEYARSLAKLVYVVDRPQLNDINMAGIAKLGDIRVAVSTSGLSPAMAGLLRRKIESLISPEDILQVKLQGEIRGALKNSVKNPTRRKELVYKLLRNKRISCLLNSNRFEDAKLRALSIIKKNSAFA